MVLLIRIIKHFALVFGMFALVNQGIAQDLGDLLGDQYALIESVKDLSSNRDYEEVYDVLSRDYRSVVGELVFVDTLSEKSWFIESFSLGRISEYGNFAFAPVRAVSRVGRREIRIDTVAFFIKEENQWKLYNFPFMAPHLPDFGTIPKLRGSEDEVSGKK